MCHDLEGSATEIAQDSSNSARCVSKRLIEALTVTQFCLSIDLQRILIPQMGEEEKKKQPFFQEWFLIMFLIRGKKKKLTQKLRL